MILLDDEHTLIEDVLEDVEMRTCTSVSDMMMSIDDDQMHIPPAPTGPGMLTADALAGINNVRANIARWLECFQPFVTSTRSRPPSLSGIPSISDIDIEASSLVPTDSTTHDVYILNDQLPEPLRFGDVSRTILRQFLKETKSRCPTHINPESIREDIERYLCRWYMEKCFNIYAGLAILNPSTTITLGDVGRLVGVGDFISFFNIHSNLHIPPGTEHPLFPVPPQADVELDETLTAVTGYNCHLDRITDTRATLSIVRDSTRLLLQAPGQKRRSWPEWEGNTTLLKGFIKIYGPRFYELVRETKGLDIEEGKLLLIVNTVGSARVTQFLSVSKSASSDIGGDEWEDCNITSQPQKVGGNITVCEDNNDCHIVRRFGWAPEEANSIQVTHINVIPLPKTSG